MEDVVGIQIGAISFIDEGVEKTLDVLQEKGGVNTLFVSALSWSRGNAGRSCVGFPDHGVQKIDKFTGGGFWNPDPVFYGNSVLRPAKTPDSEYGNFDIFRDVIPTARKRGMKVMPYYCETPRSTIRHTSIPNAVQAAEIDAFGRTAARPCNNNPLFRNWFFSMIEDWLKNCDADGLLWGIEQQSGLKGLLCGEPATCFCPFCCAKAEQLGIDVDRAREGYKALVDYRSRVNAGEHPIEGYFVGMLHILLEYPEIFSWEKMWLDSHRGFHRDLAGLVKFIDPDKQMGFSIWQEITTFSPYLRAQYDYDEFVEYSDFLKPIVYRIPAGIRFSRYIKYFQPLLFHGGADEQKDIEMEEVAPLKDMSHEEALSLFYRLLKLNEASLDKLPAEGFSTDYIRNEVARACAAVGDKVKIYPGVDIGVAGGTGGKDTKPADVQASVRAAYDGGASGVILSRCYAEIMLENLQAAGDTLREIGRI